MLYTHTLSILGMSTHYIHWRMLVVLSSFSVLVLSWTYSPILSWYEWQNDISVFVVICFMSFLYKVTQSCPLFAGFIWIPIFLSPVRWSSDFLKQQFGLFKNHNFSFRLLNLFFASINLHTNYQFSILSNSLSWDSSVFIVMSARSIPSLVSTIPCISISRSKTVHSSFITSGYFCEIYVAFLAKCTRTTSLTTMKKISLSLQKLLFVNFAYLIF